MNILLIYRLGLMALVCLQSLTDIAREEAQRRKLLDQQGIEAKVIIRKAAGGSRDTDDSPSVRPVVNKSHAQKDLTFLRRYRNALQKLDRSIRQNEDKLRLLRARLQLKKNDSQKLSKKSGALSASPQDRLREQIEDLEIKLKQLQDERFETYEAGKKAGFLPGELEGREF
jgi:hypothetical protein